MNTYTRPLITLMLICTIGATPIVSAAETAEAAPEWLRWHRSELYFGLGRPDNRSVSDEQWKTFLRDEVTRRFPSGFTVMTTYGQWQNRETGTIGREESRVLVLLHPGDPATLDLIEEIRRTYMQRFEQQSVIHSIQPANVRF